MCQACTMLTSDLKVISVSLHFPSKKKPNLLCIIIYYIRTISKTILLVISINKESKPFLSYEIFSSCYDNGISISANISYSSVFTQSNLILLARYHLLRSPKIFPTFSPKIEIGKTLALLNVELEKKSFLFWTIRIMAIFILYNLKSFFRRMHKFIWLQL